MDFAMRYDRWYRPLYLSLEDPESFVAEIGSHT